MTTLRSLRWACLFIAGAILATFWPSPVYCQSIEEILSKAFAGLDLPDVGAIGPVYGTVSITIQVAATKNDEQNRMTTRADIIAQWVITQTSSRWMLKYTVNGTYTYDKEEIDDNGRPCRHIDVITISDSQTVLDFPTSHSLGIGTVVTSKKLGVARFWLSGVTTAHLPKCKLTHKGCNPCVPECTEFADIQFLTGIRIPSYGAGGTKFSTFLNAMEEQGKEVDRIAGLIEGRFDGERTKGEYSMKLLDGLTIPAWKTSELYKDAAMEDFWPATLTVRWNLSGEEEATIKIVSPKPDEDQVFKSGKLVINAEAKVEPSKYEKDVVWETQDVQGSKKTIKPAKGSKVTITFDKLPSDNNQFGEKLITAKVRGKEDQVKVRFFFERDTKDNPGRREPNWFYYWRQGVVGGLERFKYKPGGSLYNPAIDELVISDEAVASLPGGSVPLQQQITIWDTKQVCTVQGSINLVPTDGVDSAARLVAHELEHERLSKMARAAVDRDQDQVPDELESSSESSSPFCLDPRMSNTHGINVGRQASGDSEVLAIDAESKSRGRVKHNLDWAYPGSQSKLK